MIATTDAVVMNTKVHLPAFADHLGGIQKVATSMQPCSREEVLSVASSLLLGVSRARFGKKMPYSVSCYGEADGMQSELLRHLKRILVNSGGHGRFVHKDMTKNAPNVQVRNQVLESGIDILVIGSNEGYYVGRTAWIQDVDSYARRDMMKPRRDMHTGMLPPKLAQTLINLTLPEIGTQPIVWDPFCGLGVIPMEVLLMGFPVVASDINPQMQDNTQVNLDWLTKDGERVPPYSVHTIDVRHWDALPAAKDLLPNCIVTEGTLGHNFLQRPTKEDALREQQELLALYDDMFFGLSQPAAANIRAVTMTVPFHILEDGTYLRLVPDMLSSCYSYGFEPALDIASHEEVLRKAGLLETFTEEGTILYTRKQQNVGREILILRRAA
ncbi:hypothetical protein COW46_02350 [Candidatus Gracilibacteria bacterium CG17_big_fil_post_rev_8_21_14_2_50_48_13]|nr:MAG: hypothetical protein COW46_02350 [Candidatus Gracilibacteria bacterium CG17_big_fil_post_rev_8_21_14_2_50_48_13]